MLVNRVQFPYKKLNCQFTLLRLKASINFQKRFMKYSKALRRQHSGS